ncbi:MAG: MBL fold metallo-hydrolase [Clostridiales bacterium]|nr:MBL fold metallo-hydrolase [Clostridiales bacterium]
MKITWLGQAGLLFEKNGVKIMIDPYLSNSVEKINPKNYRRVPVLESLFDIQPDIMIFTHNHLDHYDPETVKNFITDKTSVTVLAPSSVWTEVRKIGGNNNFVQFNRYTEWTEKGIKFSAVKAEHSDITPIGVIIDDGEKKYYITGDTLYNKEIFNDLPKDIDVVFLPVNGVGNNMNAIDAQRFCEVVKPKYAVPIHFGMFDSLTGEEFSFNKRVIPKIYKEIELK